MNFNLKRKRLWHFLGETTVQDSILTLPNLSHPC